MPAWGQMSLYSLLAVFFAIALQIQVTLFSTPDYLGLRVNLGDFILPFLGVFILISLLRERSHWPRWFGAFGYWALALLSGVIVFSCVNGYFTLGHWSSWAVVNKTLGWFILVAYMGAGAWIAANSDSSASQLFIKALIVFFCFTGLFEVSTHFLSWEIENSPLPLVLEYVAGFMHNRNAFAFLFMTVMILTCEALLPSINGSKANKVLFYCFWALAPFCILMNGSRTLWLTLIPLFILLLARHKTAFAKHALPIFLIGAVLLPVVFQNNLSYALRPFYQSIVVFQDQDTRERYRQEHFVHQDHDSLRLTIFGDGLALIQERPFTGAGLGAILEYQEEQYGEVLSVMDNTLLWILVEMGPFGLFSFLLVYIAMLHTLYKNKGLSALHSTAFFMLIGFGFFSLFHEILYTRFFWFILGMTLAVPIARRDGSKAEV